MVTVHPPSPTLTIAALVACMLAACGTFGTGAGPAETEDGLTRVDVKGVDAAYLRPGSTLASYSRIQVDPAEVAFSKEWKPEEPGSHRPLSDEDRNRISGDLSELFGRTFAEVLEKGGYPVVTEPGTNVLRVTPKLTDVYINAPDVQTAGRSSQYTRSAGHMTLVAELRDSQSGELLGRIYDRRDAPQDVVLRLTTSVSNSQEARNAMATWANVLLGRLNAVRVQSPPPP